MAASGVEGQAVDRGVFDRLAKVLGSEGSRRAAIGVFAAGIAGTSADALGKKKRRKSSSAVAAQATLSSSITSAYSSAPRGEPA